MSATTGYKMSGCVWLWLWGRYGTQLHLPGKQDPQIAQEYLFTRIVSAVINKRCASPSCVGTLLSFVTYSVPVPCLFKIKYYHLRLNKAKYLVLFKTYASPTFIGYPRYIFSCILRPMQLQMVIFDFEEKGTGTEHVAIATSKYKPSGIFCKVEHPCQVSKVLLHYWQRYS